MQFLSTVKYSTLFFWQSHKNMDCCVNEIMHMTRESQVTHFSRRTNFCSVLPETSVAYWLSQKHIRQKISAGKLSLVPLVLIKERNNRCFLTLDHKTFNASTETTDL